MASTDRETEEIEVSYSSIDSPSTIRHPVVKLTKSVNHRSFQALVDQNEAQKEKIRKYKEKNEAKKDETKALQAWPYFVGGPKAVKN
jgi:hypothetical protein